MIIFTCHTLSCNADIILKLQVKQLYKQKKRGISYIYIVHEFEPVFSDLTRQGKNCCNKTQYVSSSGLTEEQHCLFSGPFFPDLDI